MRGERGAYRHARRGALPCRNRSPARTRARTTASDLVASWRGRGSSGTRGGSARGRGVVRDRVFRSASSSSSPSSSPPSQAQAQAQRRGVRKAHRNDDKHAAAPPMTHEYGRSTSTTTGYRYRPPTTDYSRPPRVVTRIHARTHTLTHATCAIHAPTHPVSLPARPHAQGHPRAIVLRIPRHHCLPLLSQCMPRRACRTGRAYMRACVCVCARGSRGTRTPRRMLCPRPLTSSSSSVSARSACSSSSRSSLSSPPPLRAGAHRAATRP